MRRFLVWRPKNPDTEVRWALGLSRVVASFILAVTARVVQPGRLVFRVSP
jgi:hypothetical protein